VLAGPARVDAAFVVGEGSAPRGGGGVPLALLSASRGGIDVDARRWPQLADFLRAHAPRPIVRDARHPMRSAWWIAPFAFCLSAEWWLRRRAGLR
jgi:hypothetical protein